ncbi:MAG: hypothetical protein H7839_08935 [Magnetococcus sp. YQC-5]
MNGRNATMALENWGESIPAWVLALAQECDRTSQVQAAKAIGYSPAAVNTVLKQVYQGDTSRIQRATEDCLMHAEVDCPFYGRLLRTRCQEALAGLGPSAVKRSCRVCKNNPGRKWPTQHSKGDVCEA